MGGLLYRIFLNIKEPYASQFDSLLSLCMNDNFSGKLKQVVVQHLSELLCNCKSSPGCLFFVFLFLSGNIVRLNRMRWL